MSETTSQTRATNASGLISQTENYLNEISAIREYYENNPTQARSANVPNFQGTIGDLNSVLLWCRSNESTVTKILQGKMTGTAAGSGGNRA